MTEHTPGPWRKHGNEITGPNNQTIAITTNPNNTNQTHANANLITAAPDLFNALQQYAIAEFTKNPEQHEHARTTRIQAMMKALGEKP